MPIYKATVAFEAGGAGWTEQYYFEADTVLLAVGTMTQDFAVFRMALVAKSDTEPCKIVAIKVQNVENLLDQRVVTTDFRGTYVTANLGSTDMPWTGVVLRITAKSGARRSFTMRGVPDEVIEGSYKEPILRNAWSKALNDWFKDCVANAFLVRSTKGAGGALVEIASIVAASPILTITTVAAHGLAVGDFVTFNGVKAAIKLTGSYRVVSVTNATTYAITGFNVATVGFVSGRQKKRGSTTSQWGSLQFVRKGERKAGRPFFLLRGRK